MSDPLSPASPAPSPRRFGPSARALRQRRGLAVVFKALLLLLLLTIGLTFQPPALALGLLKWLILGGLAWGIWTGGERRLLGALMERELLLHDQALELRRGTFKRFVVFSSLRHIKVVQGPDERLLSLTLDLDDDSVTLRDLDGLPEAFAAVAGAKPDSAVIEIDERRFDWAEPVPWAMIAVGLSLLLAALAASLMADEALLKADARLLMLQGGLLGAWRPFGREQNRALAPELACALLLLSLGWVLQA
jgi:hypothetical protein